MPPSRPNTCPDRAAPDHDYITDTHAKTNPDPAGLCQNWGAGAEGDPQLRVNGIDGLRIVDASVMPEVGAFNADAPALMTAQNAADMIHARHRRANPIPAGQLLASTGLANPKGQK